ncbi:MAG: GNAT family N-acetyltransferase [Pseudomonadota bacterium]
MIERSQHPATVAEYCALRDLTGLGAFSERASTIALDNSLFAVWMRDAGGQLIAMGRIIGDGGCFAQVTDIAVHPDFQGRGLGTGVMQALTDWMEQALPTGCYVSMIADPGAERLYERFGFEPRTGMARTIR